MDAKEEGEVSDLEDGEEEAAEEEEIASTHAEMPRRPRPHTHTHPHTHAHGSNGWRSGPRGRSRGRRGRPGGRGQRTYDSSSSQPRHPHYAKNQWRENIILLFGTHHIDREFYEDLVTSFGASIWSAREPQHLGDLLRKRNLKNLAEHVERVISESPSALTEEEEESRLFCFLCSNREEKSKVLGVLKDRLYVANYTTPFGVEVCTIVRSNDVGINGTMDGTNNFRSVRGHDNSGKSKTNMHSTSRSKERPKRLRQDNNTGIRSRDTTEPFRSSVPEPLDLEKLRLAALESKAKRKKLDPTDTVTKDQLADVVDLTGDDTPPENPSNSISEEKRDTATVQHPNANDDADQMLKQEQANLQTSASELGADPPFLLASSQEPGYGEKSSAEPVEVLRGNLAADSPPLKKQRPGDVDNTLGLEKTAHKAGSFLTEPASNSEEDSQIAEADSPNSSDSAEDTNILMLRNMVMLSMSRKASVKKQQQQNGGVDTEHEADNTAAVDEDTRIVNSATFNKDVISRDDSIQLVDVDMEIDTANDILPIIRKPALQGAAHNRDSELQADRPLSENTPSPELQYKHSPPMQPQSYQPSIQTRTVALKPISGMSSNIVFEFDEHEQSWIDLPVLKPSTGSKQRSVLPWMGAQIALDVEFWPMSTQADTNPKRGKVEVLGIHEQVVTNKRRELLDQMKDLKQRITSKRQKQSKSQPQPLVSTRQEANPSQVTHSQINPQTQTPPTTVAPPTSQMSSNVLLRPTTNVVKHQSSLKPKQAPEPPEKSPPPNVTVKHSVPPAVHTRTISLSSSLNTPVTSLANSVKGSNTSHTQTLPTTVAQTTSQASSTVPLRPTVKRQSQNNAPETEKAPPSNATVKDLLPCTFHTHPDPLSSSLTIPVSGQTDSVKVSKPELTPLLTTQIRDDNSISSSMIHEMPKAVPTSFHVSPQASQVVLQDNPYTNPSTQTATSAQNHSKDPKSSRSNSSRVTNSNTQTRSAELAKLKKREEELRQQMKLRQMKKDIEETEAGLREAQTKMSRAMELYDGLCMARMEQEKMVSKARAETMELGTSTMKADAYRIKLISDIANTRNLINEAVKFLEASGSRT